MMKQLKKHSVLFLVWVFLFPIAYQSIHSIHHHLSHELKASPRPYSGITLEAFNNNHCPVCEYEFPINNLPEILSFVSKPLPVFDYYNSEYTFGYHSEVIHTTAPRGPPVHC